MTRSTPNLTQVMREFVLEGLGGTHTMEPGRIVSYDADTQTCTVQPVVRSRFVDADTDASFYELPPPIANTPVAFPSGGGTSIVWPLERGDFVTIIYAERSIDEWQATASSDNIPQDTRRHDRTDAIVVPGLRSPADPLEENAHSPNAMVIKVEEIRIGDADVSTWLARADRVAERLKRLEELFETHIHTYTLPAIPASLGPTLTPPTSTPATNVRPFTVEDDVRATKVKGD